MKTEYFHYYLLLILTMIFWGATWPVTKVLVTDIPPFTVGFFRFLLASVFFLPIHLSRYHPLGYSKETFIGFFWLGLIGIFGYGVFFLIGMTLTTAAQGAIIAGINPATVSISAHIIHKERLKYKWQYIGFLISFFGVIFVIGIQAIIDFQLSYFLGNVLILLAMVTWGFYSSLGKKEMNKHSAFEVTSGAVFVGMIFFSSGAILENFWTIPELQLLEFWGGIFILGFLATFLSFSFYFMAIQKIGATNSAIFINLVPIFGILFSAIFLKETIYWTFIIGLILIIIGIFIINLPLKKKKYSN